MVDLAVPFGDGLPVILIATPRCDLVTCKGDEPVQLVLSRNGGEYDHIPVSDHNTPMPEHEEIIIGSLHTKREYPTDQMVSVAMARLNGRLICGETSSIVDFIEGIRMQPHCFTVGKSGISGLVTWSDIQKLPARAALFARVTQLELVMMGKIENLYPDNSWIEKLTAERQNSLRRAVARAQRQDNLIEQIHYTGLGDKRDLLAERCGGQPFHDSLVGIQALRNSLAHAGNYARTHEAALESDSKLSHMIS
jgi:hypothetical protein